MESLIAPSRIDSSIFHDIWQYTLVKIAGNDIKVNNIVIAILLLVFGLQISRKLTKVILQIISRKLHHNQDMLHNIERLILYTFFGITTLITLQIANIPLTIFAFIGGAFAIGLGLGAQGLVSNLINTIIIMIEKPIKIGDIIEIEGTIGTVKSIGARCIKIDSFNSGEVLVPNTILMQNKISNWSCKDSIVYSIYLSVQKKPSLQIDHNLIIQELEMVASELRFLIEISDPEIYLTKISLLEDQFFFKFACNIQSLKERRFIKDKINFALLKHCNNLFRVEYSKNLG